MTRQEAKKTLKTLMYYPVGTAPKDKCVDALNMAIQALEQEPTAEYSSDVISREEVKKQTTKKNSIWNTITDSSGRGLDEILDSIPSAQPDVPDTNVGDIISRQAVIEALHTRFRDGFDGDKWWNSTHVLAVIEGLPSAQPERKTDGDTISRQAAIDAFDGVKVDEENCTEYDIGYNDGIDLAVSKLSVLPSAQPFTEEQIQTMQELESAQIEKAYELGKADRPKWIPCSERLPECEQEVLICTEKKLVGKDAYIDSIITPAIYEDGTMLEVESMWHWDDIDFDEWDDTEDCGIIPMGWFENRHFNPDEVYNNPVDRKVVAWMPLPEAYREDGEEE